MGRLLLLLWVLAKTLLRAPLRRLRHGPGRPSWSIWYEIAIELLRAYSLQNFARSYPDQRASWEAIAGPPPFRRKLSRKAAHSGGVLGEWFVPHGLGEGGPTVLYLHGGSYIYGSTKSHQELISRLALKARARVFGANYRLAPEHPAPAAAHDALFAYAGLLQSGIDPGKVVIAGDSAVGALVIASMLQARERGLPLPAGGALICPWVDLSADGGSLRTNERFDWALASMFSAWARVYLGPEGDPRAPLVSPLFAELTGLPPLLIQVGDAEMLFDQVTAFASKAKSSGVDTRLRVYEDMVHNWHVLGTFEARANEAIEEIARFVQERTSAVSGQQEKPAAAS